jgi:addiction module HigA family antidote
MKNTMIMHSPLHPGKMLKEDFIEPMISKNSKLTITKIAKDLGVGRQTFSNIINGHSAISPEMALRLEKAFPHTDAEFWLNLQKIYDLWQAKQKIDVQNVVTYYPSKIRFNKKRLVLHQGTD